MKFEVEDRLVILNVLPKEGDIVTVRLLRDLALKIGFTAKEQEDYKIVTLENGQVKWDLLKAKAKEIELLDPEKKAITEALEEFNKQKKLNFGQIKLYEVFCKK